MIPLPGLQRIRLSFFLLSQSAGETAAQELDFVQMMDANIVEFLRADFVIEMNHSVSISCHLSEEIGVFPGENFFFEKPVGYFFVLGSRVGGFPCQDVPSDIAQRFQGPSLIGFGVGGVVRDRQ